MPWQFIVYLLVPSHYKSKWSDGIISFFCQSVHGFGLNEAWREGDALPQKTKLAWLHCI